MRIPWSEQKNPCRHLGQDSLDIPTVPGIRVDEIGFGLAVGFFNTGFSVVCLPVLHLHLSKKKHLAMILTSKTLSSGIYLNTLERWRN